MYRARKLAEKKQAQDELQLTEQRQQAKQQYDIVMEQAVKAQVNNDLIANILFG